MENLNQYIPREYLALKINYLRQQLELLPKTSLQTHKVDGVQRDVIQVGRHRYFIGTDTGKKFLNLRQNRDEKERQLKIYETIWDCHFKDYSFPECNPHKIIRTLSTAPNNHVILNKSYFDNLENDANTDYPKFKNNYFDGIYYRSSAERDIAIFYTEMGIPFKYEPKIMLSGLTKPINTDFVLYIEELDTCKFHEHLGMKDSSDYLRITKVKYGNYTNAGLIPDIDILFTYDTDDFPFDIRYLSAKLNAAIFGSTLYK